MEVSEETLFERYSRMETEELVELQTTSDLTDMASAVLEKILAERGVTAKERINLAEQFEKESESNSLMPLASIGSRFIAQIIDAVLALVLLFIPFIIFGRSSDMGILIGIAAYLAYLLLQDGLPNGQSIGKRIMKIAVINKTSGKACGFAASVIRNGLLLFLGFIDLLFLGSRYRQRLGDMLANTIVIPADRNSGVSNSKLISA